MSRQWLVHILQCRAILVYHDVLCSSAVIRRHEFTLNRHRDISASALDYITFTMELHLVVVVDVDFVETYFVDEPC